MVSWVRSAQNRTLLFSYEHPANNLLFARDCSFFVTLGAFCFVDCISDTPNQPSFNRFSHKTPGFCSGFPDLNELRLRFSSRMCGCMGDVLSSSIFCSSFAVSTPQEPLATLQKFHRWIHTKRRLDRPIGVTSQIFCGGRRG